MDKQKLLKRTIENHINNGLPEIQNLFNRLRSKIKEIDSNIQEYPTKPYIGYKLRAHRSLFVEVHIQKEKIVLHLRPLEYKDPAKKVFEYNYVRPWTLRRGIDIINEDDINYAIPLIKKSYNDIL